MAWFKVDDKLHDHRKARAAKKAAMGVWVLAGSWCADNLTDGFVPTSVLARWGTRYDARALVEVGLWYADEQDGEQGWRFHDWDEFQPTRAQKMAEREAKAEAGRKGGVNSGRSRREASTKQSASALVEPPSRPVPTPSVVTSNSQSSTHRLDHDGLTKIMALTKGSERHAERTAETILTRATVEVLNPTRYVLAAIEAEPELYRYRRGNPTRATACHDHPGEWADACRIHTADYQAQVRAASEELRAVRKDDA